MKSREGIKNKRIVLFFNLVGPILLLSAEKRTERSIVYGLNRRVGFFYPINPKISSGLQKNMLNRFGFFEITEQMLNRFGFLR